MKSYDVIIVGGGPVGSYVAYQLAGRGYNVAVVEQKAALGDKICCAGIISPRCVDSFALGEDIILRRVNSAKLFSPSGGSINLWRQETQACIVDRPAFNVAMASPGQIAASDRLAWFVLKSKVPSMLVPSPKPLDQGAPTC